MEPLKPKPAFVTFETRPVENRIEQIAAGMPKYIDVDYAFVTPAGSKDRIEKLVSEWLPQLKHQVQQGMLPAEWAKAYTQAYEYFKEGKEPPVDGTDIRNWPGATPAQIKRMIEIRVRSVEDLAAANEETLHAIGMGARALQLKAREYFNVANDTGKVAERITALQITNDELTERNKALDAKIEAMATTLKILQAAIGSGGAAGRAQDDDSLSLDVPAANTVKDQN